MVPASEAEELGLSRKLKWCATAPTFNCEQPASLNGVREPHVAAAKIDSLAAKVLGLSEGYYVLKKTVSAIKGSRSHACA